jgi:hypothetical protein
MRARPAWSLPHLRPHPPRAGPAPRMGASAVRTSEARTDAPAAAPLLLTIAWRRAPPRPPQAMLFLPPEPAQVTGVQAPTYRGGLPPHLFLLFLLLIR